MTDNDYSIIIAQ